MKREVFVRKGRIQDMDRSFDLIYWQAQSPKARFDAVWELIIFAEKVKGVDILMGIPRAKFDECWQRRNQVDSDGLPVGFISKNDLIQAKHASGRPQDLIDADSLSKMEK
jgi:hypothetical protein